MYNINKQNKNFTNRDSNSRPPRGKPRELPYASEPHRII